MNSRLSPRRIAVIGGGLAGLATAHRLIELAQEQGQLVEVTIFEAESRLDGVVGTERIGDYLVDVGADSFLTNKPGAVGLCRRLGIADRLVATDKRYRGAFVLYEGRPVRVPEGFQLLSPTAIWPVIASPLFSVWGKLRLLMEWFVPPRNQPQIGSQQDASANPSADKPRSELAQPFAANSGASARPERPGHPLLPGHSKANTVARPLSSTAAHSNLVDESLADFTRRRFGREALERLVQPLVGGIYTSDPEKLSLAATMPRFLEMERDYGSLMRATLFKRDDQTASEQAGNTRKPSQQDLSSGARYGLFAGLVGGMDDLIGALKDFVSSHCQIRLNCPVVSVTRPDSTDLDPAETATSSDFDVLLPDGSRERFSAVVITTSSMRTANLMQELDQSLSRSLSEIEFASSALVVSGHRLADIRHPLDSFGLVVPHVERRKILAVSFSSRKFPDRAPAGRVLLRTFVGGALQPELLQQTDPQLIEIVRGELADIFGVRGEPDFVRVYRYPHAMPQYHVGHLDLVAQIDAKVGQHRGLGLAGIAYRGVGIPDVITSGEQAAEKVLRQLFATA